MRRMATCLAPAALAAGCPAPDREDGWQVVHEGLPGALLSVWGESATDVWAVGADARDGTGPLVLHFDGEEWERLETGRSGGDLWWVFGVPGGPIYMGGDGGVILSYAEGYFRLMETPGTQTVFGIWGASQDAVWAVGGASDAAGGFAWVRDGDAFVEQSGVPDDIQTGAALWKIFGRSADDAWIVGSNGAALHWDGEALSTGDTGVGSSLFTVHAHDGRYVAVGGLASGIIVENEGDGWENRTPDPPPMGLSGVTLGPQDTGVAVGFYGGVWLRDAAGWHAEDPGLGLPQNLHGCWIDEEGGLWAVGGQTLAAPFTDGVMIHRGRAVPSEAR
jgi:hypothetical protein